MKKKYLDCLESKLHDLSLFGGIGNIDSHVEKLSTAMRHAAHCAGCVPRRVLKPKPYWRPELSQLRDRKDFWWTLWVANDRQCHGAVYECHKGIKKLFRKMCRKKVQNLLDSEFYSINECFRTRNMNSFWNKIKKRQSHKANSSLDAQTIADTYKSTMSCNDTPLDQFHSEIDRTVKSKFQEWIRRSEHSMFTESQIDRAICALRKNVWASIDGITAEYFIYGNSEVSRSHCISLYNAMFTHTFLPFVLATGIIIPILKKST